MFEATCWDDVNMLLGRCESAIITSKEVEWDKFSIYASLGEGANNAKYVLTVKYFNRTTYLATVHGVFHNNKGKTEAEVVCSSVYLPKKGASFNKFKQSINFLHDMFYKK